MEREKERNKERWGGRTGGRRKERTKDGAGRLARQARSVAWLVDENIYVTRTRRRSANDSVLPACLPATITRECPGA